MHGSGRFLLVVDTSADGTIRGVRGDALPVLGLDESDVVGASLLDLVHPEDRGRARLEVDHHLATGGDARTVLRLLTSDGYTWVELTATAYDVQPDGSRSTTVELRPVDGAREQERVLAEAERRFRMLVENAHDVVVHNVGGVIEWVSPSVHQLLGYTAEELVGHASLGLWHPDDVAAAVEMRDRAQSDGRVHGLLRLRHKDGRSVVVDVAVNDDGDGGMVVALRDATAQHAAETALEAREAEYRLLAENAADLVYRLGLDRRYEWLSPSVRTVLGWEPEELVGRIPFSLIHPDDQVRIRADQRARERESGAELGTVSMSYEARALRKDGGYTWMSMGLRPLVVDDVITGYVGTASVIEREVQARAAAQRSEELLTSTVASAPIGIASIDFQGRLLRVNPVLAQMLGHAPEWLLERRNVDLLVPEDRPLFEADRDLMLAGRGDVQTREMRFRRADGTLMWARRVAVLIRDAEGLPETILLHLVDLTPEREVQARLDHLAHHDGLTGLRNREWILDLLEGDLAHAAQHGRRVAVLFIDVDNLRTVNDSLGHVAGDELLRTLSERLVQVVGSHERVGRFAGDEYLVVLPDVAHALDVEQVVAAVLDTAAQPVTLEGSDVVPSVSVGVALSEPGASPTELVRDANTAMFHAKSAGKGSWRLAESGMHADAVARLHVESELRQALRERQFVVHYQPIVSLGDRAVVGHEALVRWQHPVRGLVPPGVFLPVAEATGLIVEIGHQVLEDVCALLARRPDLPGTIAVNKSPRQLDRPNWKERFLGVVRDAGVDPARLVIEVTETAVLDRVHDIRGPLDEVRDLGVGIHVDDFGTGFSSIALLRDLPVTGLKLDASFTRTLTEPGGPSAALAAGLAGLADGLGITGIAEGIETETEAALLTDLGWEHGQGYHFARPGPEVLLRLPD